MRLYFECTLSSAYCFLSTAPCTHAMYYVRSSSNQTLRNCIDDIALTTSPGKLFTICQSYAFFSKNNNFVVRCVSNYFIIISYLHWYSQCLLTGFLELLLMFIQDTMHLSNHTFFKKSYLTSNLCTVVLVYLIFFTCKVFGINESNLKTLTLFVTNAGLSRRIISYRL